MCARVAGAALGFGVRSCQRKVCLAVIKGVHVPGLGGMATCAILSHGPVMGVVFLVAGEASAGGVAQFFPCRMTGGACRIRMRSGQFKVCEIMVESLSVQADDVEFTPLMFRMAGLAFLGDSGRVAAMKAGAGLDIGPHFYVTGNAECFLVALAERGMTPAAFAFDLLVCFCHWPWHHKSLKGIGMGARSCKKEQRAKQQYRYVESITHHIILLTVGKQ